MFKISWLRTSAFAAASAALFMVCGASVGAESQTPQQTYQLNIPAQNLNDALQALALVSRHRLFYQADIVSGKVNKPLKGTYTAEEAISQILAGTGLEYEISPDGVVFIRGKDGASRPAADVGGAAETLKLARTDSPASAQEKGRGDEVGAQGQNDARKNSAAANDTDDKIPEMIVTATKRQQRAQDIPMSIAVVNRRDIERRGLIGMEDYLRSIPGVSQIDNGPISNAIIIRGITTGPQFENLGSGTTVATYFDETPITSAGGLGQGGIDLRPVDLERIEVLRGPQGTAYGSSSLGGTLRLIPARPQLDKFSANFAAAYGSTRHLGGDNSMLQGTFNAPLLQDRFALRATAYRYDESGFYRNVVGSDAATIALAAGFGLAGSVQGFFQDDIGRTVSEGGRLSALWKPAEKASVLMSFLTQTIEQDGGPVTTNGTFNQVIVPIAPIGRVRGETGEVADTGIDLANLIFNYESTWGDLTSALSWVHGESQFAVDLTRTFLLPVSQSGDSDFESLTGEVRFASRLQGPLQFLAGVYYEDVDNDYHQTIDWPGTPATNPFGTNPTLVVELSRPVDQTAVFGEVSYALTSRFTATLGGRYFSYDKGDSTFLEGGLANVPFGTGVPAVLSSTEDHSSFKANVSFKPDADSLLYASWSQGFRLGRPDPGAIAATCDFNNDGTIDGTNISIASTRRIESDLLDNYELGAKFAFLERRVTLEGAAYYIDWNGLPVRTFTSTTCGFMANSGAAVSKGVELQTAVLLTDGLRVEVGGGYTNAELAEDAPAQGWRDGDRLPGSPRLNANLAAEYNFDIAGRRAFVRADSLYVGRFYSDLQQTSGMDAGDYVKIDARAGMKFNQLSVELFARNLTDEDAYTWRDPFRSSRLRPRTIGIQLGYGFE